MFYQPCQKKGVFSKDVSKIADLMLILFSITNNFMVSCNTLNKYAVQGVKEQDIKFNTHWTKYTV